MPGNCPNMSLQVTVCDPGVGPGMPDEDAASNTDYDSDVPALSLSISAIPPSFRTILVPIDSYSRRRINYIVQKPMCMVGPDASWSPA